MTASVETLQPGLRVRHPEFGEGVLVEAPRNGYVRAFFGVGERQVPIDVLEPLLSDVDRVLAGVRGDAERVRLVWLSYEAHALQQIESAAALTSARIDLLPHQVVLTHRIATGSPRRYLIADEVGLGKTIETALVLRELASRGEFRRALMVVPAGLVNNWHRELNEVFHLDFEVFGSEGDVTDRKSNAFAKHDRLIASIDTLKRPARMRRIEEAPLWDLVVFDEAHHLTAYRTGHRVRKTENYKLAEVLKGRTRDMLLLSATPHQGDHFRFWMLIQLLNPTVVRSPEDMVHNRHRLNALVFRRTKADACRPDGKALFARRWVHTESFTMSESERRFYNELREYLQEGFALAKRQGKAGQALGFIMAIFQKIAASSFAAVRRTLRRRAIGLTIHEAIERDAALDIDGRENLYEETRRLIHEEFGLPQDSVGRGEADRILADLKLRLLKKIQQEDLEIASSSASGEEAAQTGEDLAATSINVGLPMERERIYSLLDKFPKDQETKVTKLLQGLGALWRQNERERVVIFATYLGTVELLQRSIEEAYPGQGVVVLRGGDHGAKLAAERRFKAEDGPRVLVCTAAGREGINLQFARVLFDFDLPWNPMDIEQRIGRIHRYGQKDTAQVYNLVLSDTIEGRIFLLLNDKLNEIARAVGKVDDDGNIAEDLRSQVLGQLSERINYDKLYQQALSDPELKRTDLELEAALTNATEARKVVSDLFQDLEDFNLDDYKPFEDVTGDLKRLVSFLRLGAEGGPRLIRQDGAGVYTVLDSRSGAITRFTIDRDAAKESESLDLLGLDHPLVQEVLQRYRDLAPDELGVAVKGNGHEPAVVTWWSVEVHGKSGDRRFYVRQVTVNLDGQRLPQFDGQAGTIFSLPPTQPHLDVAKRSALLKHHIEPMLQRDLEHNGLIPAGGGFMARLIAWVEIVAAPTC